MEQIGEKRAGNRGLFAPPPQEAENTNAIRLPEALHSHHGEGSSAKTGRLDQQGPHGGHAMPEASGRPHLVRCPLASKLARPMSYLAPMLRHQLRSYPITIVQQR